ncbi:hypothetical protein PM022_12945 [Halorubrum ezzemoulense]|uniref:hypothetical protein n=1 Tax=Halorubrum ezzemoulense TaxID=337243 RepID=UPI00232F4F4E|nr:hypothetical protein [Halorubrum ezzemoulense]MDB2275435.1 hypothetical protein [Halorubrum ezzemoulense]
MTWLVGRPACLLIVGVVFLIVVPAVAAQVRVRCDQVDASRSFGECHVSDLLAVLFDLLAELVTRVDAEPNKHPLDLDVDLLRLAPLVTVVLPLAKEKFMWSCFRGVVVVYNLIDGVC